ncbi:hypothetical protein [Oceanobacter mangrovi]|uniref:hypothetical protein n=1 Tax=Oceanobacter mangrovi TaxID=2862510 RepID=UPI001C8E83CF|nr:hypothetical protein [Oceanobacter mangrovi]
MPAPFFLKTRTGLISNQLGLLTSICLITTASQTLAHESQPDKSGLSSSLALAASSRSQNQLSDDDIASKTVWQIPGVLMGGHASAYEQGTSLDEMSLRIMYLADGGSYGAIKLGSHDGSELSLENAYIGQQWQWHDIPLHAEAGEMFAFFSPHNHVHPSTEDFSLAPLGFTALFGGHVQDSGLRIAAGDADKGLSAGLESYKGSAFPSASSGGLHAVYLRHAHQGFNLDWQLQGWALMAHADNRQDDRSASSGHSHSTSTTTAFDGYFDGDTQAIGLFAATGWTFGYHRRLSLTAEYLQMQVDGDVRDADGTQSIEMDSDYRSILLEPRLVFGKHSLSLRYETLSLTNRLTGSAVASLGEEAGLINNGHNPQRLSSAWNWQYNDKLRLRLEWMKDKANPDRQPNLLTAGVVWQTTLM